MNERECTGHMIDGHTITIPVESDPMPPLEAGEMVSIRSGHEAHEVYVDTSDFDPEAEPVMWCETCSTTLAYLTPTGWELP